MTNAITVLKYAQRLQALAQSGLHYAVNDYDRERYEEVRQLSVQVLQQLTDEPLEKIVRVFASDTGYQTPKVDIRAVVFRGTEEVLMVQEKIDENKWTVPGGWADIGLSPFEVAAKEAQEESGIVVKPIRLLALFDKAKHEHPPDPVHAYKVFVRCEAIGGALLRETGETAGAAWFRQDQLPSLELSTDRVTLQELNTMFEFAVTPELPTLCD